MISPKAFPWLIVLIVIGAFLITFLSNKKSSVPSLYGFAPGQVWTYQTRPSEVDSRVTILKIESDPKFGEIAHISINNLRIKNKNAPGGFSKEIEHLPYSAEILHKNLVRQIGNAPVPSFEEGYRMWKEALDQGKAGVNTNSPAEAVESIETVINSGTKTIE